MFASAKTVTALVAGAAVAFGAVALHPGGGPVASAAVGAAAAPLAPAPAGAASFLRFNGAGTVQVRPDAATISIGVDTTGATSAAALAAASRQMASLIGVMKDAGVAADDLQTSGVWTYRDGSADVWHASESLTVKVRHAADAGALLGKASAAGATSVSGPEFSISDQHAAYAQALALAIADARSKASAAAAQIGAHVTGVISISDTQSSGGPIPYAREAVAASSAGVAVPVQTGTQDVAASVDVVFAFSK